MVGAFVASFIMSEIISLAGVVWSTEMGYVIAFVVLHRHDLRAAGRHPGPARLRPMGRALGGTLIVLLAVAPMLPMAA